VVLGQIGAQKSEGSFVYCKCDKSLIPGSTPDLEENNFFVERGRAALLPLFCGSPGSADRRVAEAG
jgi:hypothetical protein